MTNIAISPYINSIYQCQSEAAKPFAAEWPDSMNPAMESCLLKTVKVFWEIISYIIFPIILIRCLMHCIRNSIYKNMMVPGAGNFYDKEILDAEGARLLNECNGKRIPLLAPDGAKLDAVFFKGTTHPEKVIFYGFGNAGQWELTQTQVERLQQLFGVSVFMINPRGVGESDGKRYPEGYALDTYTGYEYLISQKFDLNNVLFLGHSMGAAYGSCGAALIQEKYPEKPISMIHDRSYSNLTATSQALANVSCCGVPLYPIVPCFFKMFSMEIDVHKPFVSLKGEKCVIYSKKDGIIHYHKASLHKSLKEAGYEEFHEIALDPNPNGDDHNRSFNDKEEIAFIEHVENVLKLNKRSLQRLEQYRHFQQNPEESEWLRDKYKQLIAETDRIIEESKRERAESKRSGEEVKQVRDETERSSEEARQIIANADQILEESKKAMKSVDEFLSANV